MSETTKWRRGPISELEPGVWEQRTPKGIYPVKYITRHIDDVRNERVLYSRTGRLEDAGMLGDHFNDEASRSDSEWRFIGPLPGEPEPHQCRPPVDEGAKSDWTCPECKHLWRYEWGDATGWAWTGPFQQQAPAGKPEPREDGKKGDLRDFNREYETWLAKNGHDPQSMDWFEETQALFIDDPAGRSAVLSLWGEPDTSAALAEARKEIESLRTDCARINGLYSKWKERLPEVIGELGDLASLAAERDALKAELERVACAIPECDRVKNPSVAVAEVVKEYSRVSGKVVQLEKERDEERERADAWRQVSDTCFHLGWRPDAGTQRESICRWLRDRLSAPSADGDANVGIADHEDYETAGGYVLGEFTKFLNKHGEKRAKRLASLVQMLPRLKAALVRESRP